MPNNNYIGVKPDDLPLLASEGEPLESQSAKSAGPKNRLNDLPYPEWLKFQKSFALDLPAEDLLSQCIAFFTKAYRPEGSPSRSLVLGMPDAVSDNDFDGRSVTHEPHSMDIQRIEDSLSRTDAGWDFMVVDARQAIRSPEELDRFIFNASDKIAGMLRQLLLPDRYAALLVPSEIRSSPFPVAWSVATAIRGRLRLRDEKVFIADPGGPCFYCLFVQSADDERTSKLVGTKSISVSPRDDGPPIPTWIMPRSPSRGPQERYHPAKFPESLVDLFLSCFTKPGDNVIDPMVGTGSSVVASLRSGRNGFGVELSEQFAEIAISRIKQECQPELFDPLELDSKIFIGDATKLDEIDGFRQLRFQYAITSPPYWSMLSNFGSENQRERRVRNLPLVYSENDDDLGNIENYDDFLDVLEKVYIDVADSLDPGAMFTVAVKNVKRDHVVYPLAWDLAFRLSKPGSSYRYEGCTLWCQDDVSLKPFAIGSHWVSNILHTYCLHFERI